MEEFGKWKDCHTSGPAKVNIMRMCISETVEVQQLWNYRTSRGPRKCTP